MGYMEGRAWKSVRGCVHEGHAWEEWGRAWEGERAWGCASDMGCAWGRVCEHGGAWGVHGGVQCKGVGSWECIWDQSVLGAQFDGVERTRAQKMGIKETFFILR